MLFKNTWIKMRKSFGRYLSIMLIVMVGIGFYAGIQESAPSIRGLANQYFVDQQVMDFKIVSNVGFTDDDVEALEQLEGMTRVVPSYSLDVLAKDKAVRIHALEKDLHTFELVEGRMPQSPDEVIADSRSYQVGDQVALVSDVEGKLSRDTFNVVGTANSALYLSEDYGSTIVGDGKLSSYLFVERENFVLDVYTEIYMIADKDSSATAYSTAYEKRIQSLHDNMLPIKKQQEEARYEQMKSLIPAEWGEEALADLTQPVWTIMNREAIVGYEELGSSVDIVESVAAVFPVFFILIAILMTSNSMARMIAEERGELGTLTSLGFGNGSIIAMYLFYVLSATSIGAVLGFLAGCQLIPPLIYDNFLFVMPAMTIQYNWQMFALMLAVALVLMTAVTLAVCGKVLKQEPANLMRPIVQEKGQRILMERVTFLWKRLSFNWKITTRNLFRYKPRAFMTIVGVSGCTALLLVGFGLRDSMDGVVQKQYGEIFKYNNLMILKQETDVLEDGLRQTLEKEAVTNPLLLRQTAFKTETADKSLQVYLITPSDNERFEDYFALTSAKNGTPIQLHMMNQDSKADNGVIVTEKIAELWQAKIGDEIEIKDRDSLTYTLKIAEIVENYAGNYIFATSAQYQPIFDKEISYNALVSNYDGDQALFAERMIDSGEVFNVSFTDDILNKALDNNKSLNGIIVLLILVASMLAFIIIYNLTSINISERTREIATLKVLGFDDRETSSHIYREAAVLTLISIGVGLLLGMLLHGYVVDVVSNQSMMMLFKRIEWLSFVLSAVLTLAFSLIMQLFTYYKLRAIPMVESLKSVE